MERDKKRLLSRTTTPASRHQPKKQRTDGSASDDDREQRANRRIGLPVAIDLYDYILSDRSSPDPPRGKSKEGHFRFQNGDNIGSRYKILSLMGEGTFGRVLECWDRQRRETVAVKVIRSVPKYRDAAMIELEVLNTITANDPDHSACCIHLQHWFDYRGHVCIVFEKLGASLYDFMRRNGYRAFPLDIVQRIAQQLLHAIGFLHSLSIVHTDLKPENILLVNSTDYAKLERERVGHLGCRVPLNPDIRVIDFGSATFEEDRHSTVVSTRHYRAPEVILGLGWNYQCDLWSVGCIIVELITGRALFQTHENLEHLAMIETVLRPIPSAMVDASSREARRFFHHRNRTLLWQESATRKSIKAVQQLTSLKRLLRTEADASVVPHLDPLYKLLTRLLCLYPEQRSSAMDCLQDDFFRENIRSLLPHRSSSHGCTTVVEADGARPSSVAYDRRRAAANCVHQDGKNGAAVATGGNHAATDEVKDDAVHGTDKAVVKAVADDDHDGSEQIRACPHGVGTGASTASLPSAPTSVVTGVKRDVVETEKWARSGAGQGVRLPVTTVDDVPRVSRRTRQSSRALAKKLEDDSQQSEIAKDVAWVSVPCATSV